jgi:RNA polymerase subunit RPABC4/transcription elongation factor Spt4
VTLLVSQGTMSAGGVKACSRCGRPRDKKGQRYCRLCHAQYCRDRRAGMVEVLLTVEEWERVKERRARLPPLPPGS